MSGWGNAPPSRPAPCRTLSTLCPSRRSWSTRPRACGRVCVRGRRQNTRAGAAPGVAPRQRAAVACNAQGQGTRPSATFDAPIHCRPHLHVWVVPRADGAHAGGLIARVALGAGRKRQAVHEYERGRGRHCGRKRAAAAVVRSGSCKPTRTPPSKTRNTHTITHHHPPALSTQSRCRGRRGSTRRCCLRYVVGCEMRETLLLLLVANSEAQLLVFGR